MIDYKKIKIICVDCDGTLTDGMYHTGLTALRQPILFKSFYTRDFFAIGKSIRNGIDFIILTGAMDNVIDEKIRYLELEIRDHISIIKHPNSKHNALKRHAEEHGIDLSEVAYIGDDENDLEGMKMCGLTACPSDAVSIIKAEANYICDSPGGRGAVAEFISYILEHKENE